MEEKTRGKGKIVVLVVALIFLIGCAAAYLFISFYYQDHFYRSTTVNGLDASNQTAEQVKEALNRTLDSYKLSITGRGGDTQVITGKEIGLTYVDDGQVEKVLEEENPYLWIRSLFSTSSYTIKGTTSYDKTKLDDQIKGLSFLQSSQVTAPKDAYITEEDGTYTIVPEVEGNKLKEKKTLQLITKAVDEGTGSLALEDSDCYQKPKVRSDDKALTAQAKALNNLVRADITIPFGSRSEEVNGEMIHDWIVTGDDGSVQIDRDKVLDYVTKSLAYKYDTFGLEREFTTHAGKKITIPAGGDYGWCIDREATTDKLMEAIQNGETAEMEPEYIFTAKSREENDLSGTYVEINIKKQRMWCYQDGQVVVDTPVVTGTVSKNLITPPGCYAIDAKKQNAILVGETYRQPVSWWMPFVGDIGIHDAAWRSKFGGDIYKNSGSHGCVNTPADKAEIIFNTVEIGTAVVVY